MKIIVPMAGMGKRMRPHTLTTPKPLIPVGGKPIVQRLVEDIAAVCNQKIDEIAYIIGDFGEQAEKDLIAVAEKLGAKGSIYYQKEALGTAHAIYCAQESLEGNVVVAFADTLFRADFTLDPTKDGIIWVQKVEDPRAFGVIKMDAQNNITDFIEKPQEFVSDLAIIGIYYFKDGANLRAEIKYLLDNNIKEKGEFQLTNALENMKNKGVKFSPGEVKEWLDCGNKNATVYTNQRVLEFVKDKENLKGKNVVLNNSIVVEPCFLGDNVQLHNSVVGPHVSIGANSIITNAVISNSIVQTNSKISNIRADNSMVGNFVDLNANPLELSLGDYNVTN